MDNALQSLMQVAASARGPVLWIVDEQVDVDEALLPANIAITALTNRCDSAAALRARGVSTVLNDFDFGALAQQSFNVVLFRVAKEKALVHHVINRALELLAPRGELWLAGYKNEGIKTYIDKAAARAGGSCQSERNSGAICAAIMRGPTLGDALPDQDYSQLREVMVADDLTVWSKPGIFGWQKADAGSALLLQHLEEIWPQPPRRVLDLGCGYGYLTLLAARQWPAAEFVATDNNIAAVQACARNMESFGVRGQCVNADCGDGIDGGFDALLCNPPFHQGFDVDGELGGRFLHAARRLLAPRGRALFVVNQFIALERRAQTLFAQVEVPARTRSFKLVALHKS